MNRNDFQRLARTRLQEANLLLARGYFAGAYYLCGYVIECGLKACIAKKTKAYDFPDKATVNESYQHDLSKLLKVSGLELTLKKESGRDKKLGVYWNTVKDWSEKSRYEINKGKLAKDLYEAVSDRKHGVFQWIKLHW